MKKLLLILSLMFVVTLTACSKEEKIDLKEIEERGYIIMGLDDTFAPMGFRDESNEIVGFDVDLAKELFGSAGIKLRFQPIDWAMKETELNNGNIDMIWNGYTITQERKEKVNFSTPYISSRQVIITLIDSEIDKISDLEGKVLATQTGSSSLNAITESEELMSFVSEDEIILFGSYNEAFIDLKARRIDAIVADEILVRYYMSSNEETEYKILDDDLGYDEFGIGLRKESTDLLELINNLLDEMKQDKRAAKISVKWFAENIVE
ncbi:amino acid ABC transporter substrate-binding protein [Mycoplasmatota bacterium zrk1]